MAGEAPLIVAATLVFVQAEELMIFVIV